MKYGASSSIIITDYDVNSDKFVVIKRVEVPRAEYSYDKAVQTIIELNDIYDPSWIYCDAGSGEYQIEMLHKYGDEHPETGLKNKVKRMQFSQTLDIEDPVTYQKHKEPLKPFMVTQLQTMFDRERIVLSPFDDVLYKQLIDYEVVRISQSGTPIFTSVNEHFVDALGLSILAFVLEFKEIGRIMKETKHTNAIAHTNNTIGQSNINRLFHSIETSAVPMGYHQQQIQKVLNNDPNERRGDKQTYVKVNTNYRKYGYASSWGKRSGGINGSGRSIW